MVSGRAGGSIRRMAQIDARALATITTGVQRTRRYRRAVDSLERFIEEQLAFWEVPGCAVGVVRGDEVVLLAGFGVSERGCGARPGSQTIFPIGSAPKTL